MLEVEKVINRAKAIMRDRYSEPIRSRQIKVIAEAIVLEINEHAQQNKGSAEQQTDNTGSPKLPPLEEVQKHAQAIHGSTEGELLAVYRAYEFIVGWQLRAGA